MFWLYVFKEQGGKSDMSVTLPYLLNLLQNIFGLNLFIDSTYTRHTFDIQFFFQLPDPKSEVNKCTIIIVNNDGPDILRLFHND